MAAFALRAPFAVAGLCIVACSALLFAQGSNTAGTALSVRIVPAARLNPQAITVRILVDESGVVVPQTATLQAWIRALPGRAIQFVARSGEVTGPSGVLPAEVLRWEGVTLAATGGGEDAQCTSGAFTGAPDLLASGWARSGTLTCGVRFTLNGLQKPAPGLYIAQVDLALYGDQ